MTREKRQVAGQLKSGKRAWSSTGTPGKHLEQRVTLLHQRTKQYEANRSVWVRILTESKKIFFRLIV